MHTHEVIECADLSVDLSVNLWVDPRKGSIHQIHCPPACACVAEIMYDALIAGVALTVPSTILTLLSAMMTLPLW